MPNRPSGIFASNTAGILVMRPENRSKEETRTLKRLKTVHRVMEKCCTLFEQFAGMLRDKSTSAKSRPAHA
jgi:hypothetical protein